MNKNINLNSNLLEYKRGNTISSFRKNYLSNNQKDLIRRRFSDGLYNAFYNFDNKTIVITDDKNTMNYSKKSDFKHKKNTPPQENKNTPPTSNAPSFNQIIRNSLDKTNDENEKLRKIKRFKIISQITLSDRLKKSFKDLTKRRGLKIIINENENMVYLYLDSKLKTRLKIFPNKNLFIDTYQNLSNFKVDYKYRDEMLSSS